jgi:predicted TIM-barrel fold metal-dependent hydrolase
MTIAPDLATVAAPGVGQPRNPVPPGACDTHSHVFGPFDRFTPHHPSVYALPEADPRTHQAARERLGMARGVLIQPAPYGTDPAAMLAAIAQSDGALKGIAVADQGIAPCELERWAMGGVAGLRFSDMRAPGGQPYPGSVGFAALAALAPQMRDLGLHAQLWAAPENLLEHLPALLRLQVPIVLDHMAMLNPVLAQTNGLLDRLIPLVAGEDIWVKLVLCRVERADLTGGEAIRAIHEQLLAVRPERMLWGSDWPYVRLEPAPDAAVMLDLFASWAGSEQVIRQVLVDNPATLFNF